MKTSVLLCVILFAVVSSCGIFEAEVSVHRHYTSYPEEESFKIYKKGNSNNPILSWAGSRNMISKDIYRTICIETNTDYVVSLYDSERDGWSAGSYLAITNGKQVVTYTLLYGSSDSGSLTVTSYWIYFVIGFVGMIILILIIKGLISCCK